MDGTTTPSTPKKRSTSKTLSLVMVIGLLALVFALDMKRRAAENQLAQLTVRLEQLNGGNNAQNLEAAKKIVDEVGQFMQIPTDVQPTVATIVDVEALRKQNPFYEKAENGDFLLVWADRAVLYRQSAKKIIDVVPVNLQQPADATAAAGEGAESSATVQAQQ